MEERISIYELGIEVYERSNPSVWKYRGGEDAKDLLHHLICAGESIDRIANLK